MAQIILASSSAYRRQLIEKLGINAESVSPAIDESALPGESPRELVERLSTSKAKALARRFPEHLIIGSDQVAELDGSLITKPGNHSRARQQLLACNGKVVRFHTGLCLYNSASDRQQYRLATTEVKFRQLQEDQVERYLRQEQPYNCAGSFKAEGLGICLFEYLRSNDPSALIGLPLIDLTSLLLNEGIELPL
ncbi:MAG: septum formation inhibitor Maf [Gammaproteobacteria bacterium]|nr:septum formation inhibitor Maf [Gammaproteobacteria bacterium]